MFVLDKQGLAELSKRTFEDKSFSKNNVSGEDALRKIFYDALEIEEGFTEREFAAAYQQNNARLFQVIDVAVNAVMPKVVTNEFDSLANIYNINHGDTIKFKNPNTDLFRVARIASGTQDLRRQTGIASSYGITTDWYGAATYVEWEQFLIGQVNWSEFVQKIAESFSQYIGKQIYNAFIDSYNSVRTHLKKEGAFELAELIDLVRHVKTTSGGKDVTVYTTAPTLSKISAKLDLSDSMKDEINRVGFVDRIAGIQFALFPDYYDAGTTEFLMKDDALVVIPTAEKIVNVLLEGETWTTETAASEDSGLIMDFTTRKKLGFHVNQASVYGYYNITA